MHGLYGRRASEYSLRLPKAQHERERERGQGTASQLHWLTAVTGVAA